MITCPGRWRPVLAALALVLGATAQAESSAELARCAAIDSASQRLACYDQLAGRASAAVRPDAAPARASAVATAPTAAAAAAAPASSAPAAPAAEPAGGIFGLSATQRHLQPEGPSEIAATVTSLRGGAAGGTRIVLDNGQVWAVTAADMWLTTGMKVTIRRASLGSFLLITPQKNSYRVTRVE